MRRYRRTAKKRMARRARPRCGNKRHRLPRRFAGSGTFERARQHPVQSVVVSDAEAINACVRFADEHRCLVEPACGASLALAYSRPESLEEFGSVVIVVCGGIGISLTKILQWRKHQ